MWYTKDFYQKKNDTHIGYPLQDPLQGLPQSVTSLTSSSTQELIYHIQDLPYLYCAGSLYIILTSFVTPIVSSPSDDPPKKEGSFSRKVSWLHSFEKVILFNSTGT